MGKIVNRVSHAIRIRKINDIPREFNLVGRPRHVRSAIFSYLVLNDRRRPGHGFEKITKASVGEADEFE